MSAPQVVRNRCFWISDNWKMSQFIYSCIFFKLNDYLFSFFVLHFISFNQKSADFLLAFIWFISCSIPICNTVSQWLTRPRSVHQQWHANCYKYALCHHVLYNCNNFIYSKDEVMNISLYSHHSENLFIHRRLQYSRYELWSLVFKE